MSNRSAPTTPSPRYKPYPKYKDSGVEWLGQIPADWEVRRLRSTITSCQNGVWGDEPNGAHDVACVRVADFDRVAFGVKLEEPTLRSIEQAVVVARGLQAGDLLLEKSGGGENQPVGAVVLYNHTIPAVCSNFIARVTIPTGYDGRFLTYLHATLYALRINTRHIKQSTGIQNLDSSSYLGENVGLPPSEVEQRAIAAFLDRETTKIDALVAKKEKLIELLEEKRAGFITQAVTKGLDPTAPMKDSGVEWLGKIPAHWEVKPIGAISESLVGFPFPSEDFSFDEGTRLVRGDNVTTEGLRWGDKTRAWLKPAPHARYYLMEDDIVVGMDGSKVGRNYAMVRQEDLPLLLVQRVARLRARPTIVPGYLFWSIAGPRFHAHVDTCKSDPAIPHITLKNIESFTVAVPPKDEQRAILDHILTVGGKLTALLELVHDAIDHLKEVRTALISAAVTGKIDVRGEVA